MSSNKYHVNISVIASAKKHKCATFHSIAARNPAVLIFMKAYDI